MHRIAGYGRLAQGIRSLPYIAIIIGKLRILDGNTGAVLESVAVIGYCETIAIWQEVVLDT